MALLVFIYHGATILELQRAQTMQKSTDKYMVAYWKPICLTCMGRVISVD